MGKSYRPSETDITCCNHFLEFEADEFAEPLSKLLELKCGHFHVPALWSQDNIIIVNNHIVNLVYFIIPINDQGS